jgi:bifunctional non-homologous end joining protein LigD
MPPVPLARFDRPFEHPDWIFEPKMDGFRAIAYVEGGACRLVSRNHNAFRTFAPLAQAIGQDLSSRAAILDCEIVRSGPDGRPLFYELSASAGRPHGLRCHPGYGTAKRAPGDTPAPG